MKELFIENLLDAPVMPSDSHPNHRRGNKDCRPSHDAWNDQTGKH
jgi:hypothetical protein